MFNTKNTVINNKVSYYLIVPNIVKYKSKKVDMEHIFMSYVIMITGV